MGKTYTVHETTWGLVVAVWSDKGLWELGFPRPNLQAAMADIKEHGLTEVNHHPLAEQLVDELKTYLKGFKVDFGVPLDWSGYTPFQAAVLRHTAAIPYGQTETYGHVAKMINRPKAARAVGGALHINRTPIIIPCHRVVGSGGSLTGFGGGLDMKEALLLLEQGE